MDDWLQQQTRMRQRRKDKNLQYVNGAPFLGFISGAHDPATEQVVMTYHGGERKIPTLHPYVGADSWVRVGAEATPVIAATRPDSNEPNLLAYTFTQSSKRLDGYKAGAGLYRPLTPGEIEIHSRGAAQTFWSRRPLLEHRAGLIRSWLDQDELESGSKAPVHIRQLHLHKHGELGDEERFGVVQRWDGGSTFKRTFVKADRPPDPLLTALFAVESATSGIIVEPGPWAKEHTRIIKSGALFPPVLVDVREGDVIDDSGSTINLSSTGTALRYKAEYFADSILGGVFFVGIDKDGNFSVAAPDEASTGGDINIPMGDLLVTIGKAHSVTVQTDYSLATTSGSMTLDCSTDYTLTTQQGAIIMLPSTEFKIGGADEPAVLGNVMKTLMASFLDLFIQHDHVGNMGSPTPLNPAILAQAQQLKASPVDDSMMISDYIFFSKMP